MKNTLKGVKRTRSLANFVALAMLLIVSGCSRQTTQVDVSVFVTTQTGENIKLGNVPVLYIRQDAFADILNQLNLTIAKDAEHTLEKIKVECETLRKMRALPNGAASLQYAQMKLQLIADCEEYKSSGALVHDLLINSYAQSSKPAVRNSLTYTDADGKASLILPDTTHPYYIVAASERSVGNAKEKYYWLESVRPTGTARLQLSNNNLWDANSQAASIGIHLPPELPAIPELN